MNPYLFISLGHTEDEGILVTSRDHLLIPKAGEATSLIKYRIYGMGDKAVNR